MRRLTLAAAAVAALVPATLGLVGNSSFSQSVPARVPASAQVIPAAGDDHAGTPGSAQTSTPSTSRTSEVGDDHGGDRPRVDRTEPGDDHGGDRARSTSSGSSSSGSGRSGSDDSGVDDSGSRSSGGHGSDDSGRDDH